MGSITKRAVLFSTGLVMMAGGTARAATVDVRVPFPFVVEGRAMPAGQYRVESASTDPSVLLIREEDGAKNYMFVMTRPAAGRDPAGDMPALTFDRFENQYRLAGVWESLRHGLALKKQTPAHAATTHATRGVVKSVDTGSLVIVRTGKKHGEMTFALDPATHLQGTVVVGTPVAVRYREDGKTRVATAITAQPPRPQAVHAAAPKP